MNTPQLSDIEAKAKERYPDVESAYIKDAVNKGRRAAYIQCYKDFCLPTLSKENNSHE